MRVFAPAPFVYNGRNHPQGWQEIASDSTVRTLLGTLQVFLGQPVQQSDVALAKHLDDHQKMAAAGNFPVDGGGSSGGQAALAAIDRPYLLAGFGDSRSVSIGANFNSSGIWSTLNGDTGNMAFDNNSVMVQIASILGDAEAFMEFGVAGETPSSWNSATRGGSAAQQKAIGYLTASKVEAVYVQYGINGVLTSYTGANYAGVMAGIVAQLKAAFQELIKAGKFVFWDAMWPFWVNAGTYPATGTFSTEKLQMVYDINTTMQAYVALYPKSALFIDTATFIKDPATGYASMSLLGDGLHPTYENNARAIAAFIASKIRTVLPQKKATWFARNVVPGVQGYPNMVDQIAPANFFGADSGTGGGSITGAAYTTGIDTDGMPYYQLVYTPSALNSSYQRTYLEIHADVGSNNGTPFYSVSPFDLLQGQADVLIDNGSGGASTAQVVNMRLLASYVAGSPSLSFVETAAGTIQPVALEPSYKRLRSPTLQIGSTGSSDMLKPAVGKGLRLAFYVTTQTVGTPIRIRVKFPMIRKVGSGGALITPTVGASPWTYTNTSSEPQTVYVSGGTVSAIAKVRNAVSTATGLIAGPFTLAKGDGLTITYSVAPTVVLESANGLY